MRTGRLLAMVIALSGWAAAASAQTTNSPLFEPSPGPDTAPAPRWPAWQGMQDGRTGQGGNYPPYSAPSSASYPAAQQPAFPSRSYPTDRTPALRDLTQRPVSPLENAARDAGVRQQVFPAPASGPAYGR
jgi:hypothetical protein